MFARPLSYQLVITQVSCSPVMEQIIRLSREIEHAVVADLDKICDISNNLEVNQISDEIKMNVSSYLTELRFNVANKARLREISIQTNMEILRFNQIPVFFIVGKVSHPGTTRA